MVAYRTSNFFKIVTKHFIICFSECKELVFPKNLVHYLNMKGMVGWVTFKKVCYTHATACLIYL